MNWDFCHPAQDLIARLQEKGFQAIVAGGAVRDMLLERPFHDVDVLTNARPEQIREMFSTESVKVVGKHFSVCLVNGVEIASCRASSEPWFLADFEMRDLTINALGFDPVCRTLIDPFGGQKDIEARRICFVRDPFARIAEDPVRMIRACRFAAMIQGTIEEKSFQAIVEKAPGFIDGVPGERIRLELFKAMSLEKPSVYFCLMLEAGLLDQVLPCLARCRDLPGGPHHGETVFEHCLLTGDALPASRPLLRFAGYVHDAGKFDTQQMQNGHITFHGHEKKTFHIQRDLQRLRFSRAEQEYILSRIHTHMRPLTGETTPRAVRRLLASLQENHVDYRDFMRMRIADKKANLAKAPYTMSEIRVRLQKLHDELNRKMSFGINDLAVNGHEIAWILELSPGPDIGRVKEELFEKILETPEANCREALIESLKELRQSGKFRHKETNPTGD